jgi:dienelactone hydrolase
MAQTGRVEIHPITSTTLTDTQVLIGRHDGVPTAIAGELRFPAGKVGRAPVVVLLHGSGGMGQWITDWVDWFNAMGMATFSIDSFSGRGIVHTVVDQGQLGRLTVIIDAYRALDLLAKHPRIDADRAVLMGFSRGGHAALYASLLRFQRQYSPGPSAFAAYVAFYPPCNTAYRDDTQVADVPIRIFHGGADDWVPVAPCRDYIGRLRLAGKDVQLAEYAGAHHGFDSRSTATVYVKNGQTTRRCRLQETAAGAIVNADTQQEFNYRDPCVERGATIGYSEEASLNAQRLIRELLTPMLQPK